MRLIYIITTVVYTLGVLGLILYTFVVNRDSPEHLKLRDREHLLVVLSCIAWPITFPLFLLARKYRSNHER